jgi:hypothetical protein
MGMDGGETPSQLENALRGSLRARRDVPRN